MKKILIWCILLLLTACTNTNETSNKMVEISQEESFEEKINENVEIDLE